MTKKTITLSIALSALLLNSTSIALAAPEASDFGFTDKQETYVQKAFSLPYELNGDMLSATREQLTDGLLKPAMIAGDRKSPEYNPKAAHAFYERAFRAVSQGKLPVTAADQAAFTRLLEITARGEHRYIHAPGHKLAADGKGYVPTRTKIEFESDLLRALGYWSEAARAEEVKQNECLLASRMTTIDTLLDAEVAKVRADLSPATTKFRRIDDIGYSDERNRLFKEVHAHHANMATSLTTLTTLTQSKALPASCPEIQLKFGEKTDSIWQKAILISTLKGENTELCFNIGVCLHQANVLKTFHTYRPEAYMNTVTVGTDDYLDDDAAMTNSAEVTDTYALTSFSDFKAQTKANQRATGSRVLAIAGSQAIVTNPQNGQPMLQDLSNGAMAIEGPKDTQTAEDINFFASDEETEDKTAKTSATPAGSSSETPAAEQPKKGFWASLVSSVFGY